MEPTMRAGALTALLVGTAFSQIIGALVIAARAAGPVPEVDVLKGSTPLVDCSLTTPRRFDRCSDPPTRSPDLATGSVGRDGPAGSRAAGPGDNRMSPEGRGANPARTQGADVPRRR